MTEPETSALLHTGDHLKIEGDKMVVRFEKTTPNY